MDTAPTTNFGELIPLIEQMAPSVLAKCQCNFIIKVKNRNGEEFSRDEEASKKVWTWVENKGSRATNHRRRRALLVLQIIFFKCPLCILGMDCGLVAHEG